MPALMVQGTSSWAGKSLVATALCRHFARRGVRVAPFKAQNMSNNARVVAGGEIGTAQYLQALAAQAEPEVRMNPVLLKPEAETRSQVVLHGVADPELGAVPWRERADLLWPAVAGSLRSLLDEYELVVLEGAGSPAEINLAECDMTNLRAAEAADAGVLMVCDIDRGGAFAHLYGTWALMEPVHRERIGGFVLNKFRGDPSLLPPAPERLQELTGVPLAGVVPYLRHALPDEDGVALPAAPPDEGRPRVDVVLYPTASNLDELKPLERVADLRFCCQAGELRGAELVVLPGSKHVAADLAWLRERGFELALREHVARGGRLLGICGGMQMLGRELRDPAGVDGGAEGLGLLPLVTTFEAEKLTSRVQARFAPSLDGPWAALAGLPFDGYEIRHGRTTASDGAEALEPELGWAAGPVLGISPHGLFEQPEIVAALLGTDPGGSLEQALEDLADVVAAGLDMDLVEQLAGLEAI
jgi:adenosylcobyric acid synthase